LKEESKENSKAKDKGRAERVQEQPSRDQRERERRYEEERRHYKEERRRERERRREEEQRHDERRYEQKVRDDYVPKSARDQERRREVKDGPVPAISLVKDPRLTRVMAKDSDDSDNSLMKPPASIRRRRHHSKDQTTTVGIYFVLEPHLTWYSRSPLYLQFCANQYIPPHPYKFRLLISRITPRQIPTIYAEWQFLCNLRMLRWVPLTRSPVRSRKEVPRPRIQLSRTLPVMLSRQVIVNMYQGGRM
jgi:hypothetical protein